MSKTTSAIVHRVFKPYKDVLKTYTGVLKRYIGVLNKYRVQTASCGVLASIMFSLNTKPF